MSFVGKYRMRMTIGEGMFAKVKLAVNTETGEKVAIKIIDKMMVLERKLMSQVKREISIMKLLHHPNIVRIHEVIATKTKIFIVMEYVAGGQVSDKLSYLGKLSEEVARKYFQQMIDALDYCHERGIYHRDLKPENLLIDSNGSLKVSDFGLSAFHKSGELLSTACGSPSYVAPEVISHKSYDGAPADVWSCGVILFELVAGRLPFEDRNLLNLYRKVFYMDRSVMCPNCFITIFCLTTSIHRLAIIDFHFLQISFADYRFPLWFTESLKTLLGKLLNPLPMKRMKLASIIEDDWFKINYRPSFGVQNEEHVNLNNFNGAFDLIGEGSKSSGERKTSKFINAFQLIAMSEDLDLSGFFEQEDDDRQKTKLGSQHSIMETVEKIETVAKDVSLSVKRMEDSRLKLLGLGKLTRCRSQLMLSAQVTELTPTHCMVEISKSAGELRAYKEFCESLSQLLKERQTTTSTPRSSKASSVEEGGGSSCVEL